MSSPIPSQQTSGPTTQPEPPADAPRAAAVRRAVSPCSAGRDLRAHLCFWAVAVGGVALDLWSKDWAFRTLGLGGRRELIPRVIEFQTMMNDGALFGIGRGRTTLFLIASLIALVLVLWMFVHSSPRSRLLHVALGGILAGALGNMYDRVFVQLVAVGGPTAMTRYYVKQERADSRGAVLREYAPRPGNQPREIPLAALANPAQPVGYVRDFIKIPTTLPEWRWLPAKIRGKETWPWVFNVADMLLVGGVGILALRLWRDRGSPARRGSKLDSASVKA